MMFPDDYTLASGRAVKSMLESPSPELGSECNSPRDTPEAASPEEPNVRLVKYVRFYLPNGQEALNEAKAEGSRSVRQAISSEIPPDSETLTLMKSLSSKPRRRSGTKNVTFEIPQTVDKSAPTMSNTEREIKLKWKQAASLASKKAKEVMKQDTMKQENSDRELESPFGARWYPELQSPSPYPKSDSSNDQDFDEESMKYLIKCTRLGSARNREKEFIGGFEPMTKEGHRIADIEKIVQKQSIKLSSDQSPLQVTLKNTTKKAPRDFPGALTKDNRAAATISPLPSPEQLKAARAVYKGYRIDSDSTCSESGLTSGYSDMLPYSPGAEDQWTREAAANPYSEYDELQPRFSWLKRSVAPVTAIAGAILVSVASM
eukprot:g1745.t1